MFVLSDYNEIGVL